MIRQQFRFETGGLQGKGFLADRELRALTLAFLLFWCSAEAPTALASSDPGSLRDFHGVWNGNEVVAERPPPQAFSLIARDIDIAIRETNSGFALTWKSLSHADARRLSACFVASGEPDTFLATNVRPPLDTRETLWARMEKGRLVITHSSFAGSEVERIARYELIVSDGRMTFKYTLPRGDDILERVQGRLSRAKVVY